MRLAVLGATGVLGRHVLPRLLERGHRVRAVVRRPEQARALARLGVEAVLGDILDADTLTAAVEGCEAALHLATAIPKSGDGRDWGMNDRIRREGTYNLLAACAASGAPRYVQQSITFLYGDRGGEIVDETAAVQPSPFIQSAADMEAMVQASGLEWCILRGGAFYGPGTGQDESWRQAALAGRLLMPEAGEALLSLIHAADMARAVVQAAESAPGGSVYNVVDDEPVTYRELYRHVAALAGAPEPESAGEGGVRSLGCSNAKIKAALGWSPAYPTYRAGLAG